MFNNIGGKIQGLAKVICWIGIIVSIIFGVLMIKENAENALFGIGIVVLGSLLSWIGSFTLYGFGQLIENSDKLVELSGGRKLSSASSSDERKTLSPKKMWVCPRCQKENWRVEKTCEFCGYSRENNSNYTSYL